MRVVIISSVIASKRIDRATDTSRAAAEDMGIDHRRLHVAMAQQLLHRSDIVTTLQEMSCEGMLESVACRALSDRP